HDRVLPPLPDDVTHEEEPVVPVLPDLLPRDDVHADREEQHEPDAEHCTYPVEHGGHFLLLSQPRHTAGMPCLSTQLFELSFTLPHPGHTRSAGIFSAR